MSFENYFIKALFEKHYLGHIAFSLSQFFLSVLNENLIKFLLSLFKLVNNFLKNNLIISRKPSSGKNGFI